MSTHLRPVVVRPPKTCKTCRYYEKMRCRLVLDVENGELIFAKTEVARLDESLCGPMATFWTSPLDSDSDQISYWDIPEWKQE